MHKFRITFTYSYNPHDIQREIILAPDAETARQYYEEVNIRVIEIEEVI